MAKRIVWSFRARQDRKEILGYWRKRNRSNVYSKKLNRLFVECIKIVSTFPQVGEITDDANVRFKTVKDYLIFYEETDTQIWILTIWDSRQDPERLAKFLNG